MKKSFSPTSVLKAATLLFGSLFQLWVFLLLKWNFSLLSISRSLWMLHHAWNSSHWPLYSAGAGLRLSKGFFPSAGPRKVKPAADWSKLFSMEAPFINLRSVVF